MAERLHDRWSFAETVLRLLAGIAPPRPLAPKQRIVAVVAEVAQTWARLPAAERPDPQGPAWRQARAALRTARSGSDPERLTEALAQYAVLLIHEQR
jgi:hypothetical protein